MSQLAILNPTDILGKELLDELARRPGLDVDCKLLSTAEEEIGTLTEVRGAPALVQPYDPDELDRVDVAFFCGPMAASRGPLAELPQSATAIILAHDATPADGQPIVAGVSPGRVERGGVFVSPHAGAVLLAHLLAGLAPLGPKQASATVIQPASMFGKDGLDELFEQTRALLNFQGQKPEEVFHRQLAFNIFPPATPPPDLAALTNACLAKPIGLSVALLQGGVFHGVAASLSVRLPANIEPDDLRRALAGNPLIELDREEPPSPVDAAQSASILVGPIAAGAEPGTLTLWAVMDNLTVGGAVNAADIAEMVFTRQIM